jgi:hypothetical protein
VAKKTTQQKLDEAKTLYILYLRRAMRATPAMMSRLDQKIMKLQVKLHDEQEAERVKSDGR